MAQPQWPTQADFVAITAAEYSQMQQNLASEAANHILLAFNQLLGRKVSPMEWQVILHLLFDYVAQMRSRAAELGRQFYDSQRQQHIGMPKNTFLDNYVFEQFEAAMKPAYQKIQKFDASENAVSDAVLRAVKEIENGGRRTILTAVENDQSAVGWARIATGRETCGFCMMLVSRGPAYKTAKGAGLNTSDAHAERLYHDGNEEALNKLRVLWHPGCDCKVVPVYNKASWPGRDAYLRARELWDKLTKDVHYKDSLNAFRRALENGDIDLEDLSIAA